VYSRIVPESRTLSRYELPAPFVIIGMILELNDGFMGTDA